MLHRAILGTFERFLGIMIEENAGHMPFWLSPAQIAVLPIGGAHEEHCQALAQKLQALGYRATCDARAQKVNYKIREHTLQRTHFMLVVGDREMAEDTVSVRNSKMQQLGSMTVTAFIEYLAQLPNPFNELEKTL